MKTYLPKVADVERAWHLIDAEDKTVGEISTVAAKLLRGKDKPIFTPHLDVGDGVVIINAEKVALSGGKWIQKKYYRHSGYAGGLKAVTAEEMRTTKPTEILKLAVAGMVPRNRLKKDIMSRLRVFTGTEHDLQAQKPQPYAL